MINLKDYNNPDLWKLYNKWAKDREGKKDHTHLMRNRWSKEIE